MPDSATRSQNVLKKIQELKVVTRGHLAGQGRIPVPELEVIAKDLAAKGLIKIHQGTRSNSVLYAIPSLPNPLEYLDDRKPGKKAAPAVASTASGAAPPSATPPYKPRAKSPKPSVAIGSPSPAGEAPAHGSLFEVDLRFVGMLQERAGRLMGAIASESPIDGELLDLFCLTTDWLRERRATA